MVQNLISIKGLWADGRYKELDGYPVFKNPEGPYKAMSVHEYGH